jgi:putative DNA primase/helicase
VLARCDKHRLEESLMARQQESTNAQADLADLKGARFVMTSETEDGQRLAEGKLKRITQGVGRIKAVRKYENPIEFPETHKLWLDCNFLPVLRGHDEAIWRRLRAIPFNVIIPLEEQDKQLSRKLLTEAEGILAWTVAGAVEWNQHGLPTMPEIDQLTKRWRRDADQVGRFIENCCVTGEYAEVRATCIWLTSSGPKSRVSGPRPRSDSLSEWQNGDS